MAFEYDFHDNLKLKIKKLKKKDPILLLAIQKKILKIVNSDESTIEHYKNLRYNMKDQKRVHIAKHFVLTFKYFRQNKKLIFWDFDHHDKIY